jgi:DNA helicase IV
MNRDQRDLSDANKMAEGIAGKGDAKINKLTRANRDAVTSQMDEGLDRRTVNNAAERLSSAFGKSKDLQENVRKTTAAMKSQRERTKYAKGGKVK